jgi:molybdenum cofactor cytidylyltransferase
VKVAAILLAAGESTRMGTPKPLLDWFGEALVDYQIRQLREAGCEEVVVVLGHRAGEIEPVVSTAGGRCVRNESYREGRASSLRAGAEALGEPEAIVVASVDQPRPANVVRQLIEERETRAALVAAPTFEGERGHPIVVDGKLLPELRSAREETLGLRGVIGGHEDGVAEVIFETPAILLDFNTPDEYEEAKRRYETLAHE